MFALTVKTELRFDQVADRVKTASVQRLAKAALLVESEMKRSLSKGAGSAGRDAGGRFLKKEERGNSNSSAKGSPPLLRTGNLRGSIRTAKTLAGTYVIGPTTTAFYGRVHEYGAFIKVTEKMRGYLFHQFGWRVKASTIYIPPRPFALPALLKKVSQFPELFKDLPLGGSGGGE